MFNASSSRSNVDRHINVASEAIDIYQSQKKRVDSMRSEISLLRVDVQNKLLAPHLAQNSKNLGGDFLSYFTSADRSLNLVEDLVSSSLKDALEDKKKLEKINTKLKSLFAFFNASKLMKKADEIQGNILEQKRRVTDSSCFDARQGAETGLGFVSIEIENIKNNMKGLENINLLDPRFP